MSRAYDMAEDRRRPFQADLRVLVDPSEHSIHDGAETVSIVLEVEGGTAEVQVARSGPSLVVIAAGSVDRDTDPRGNARLRVWPTK